MLELISMIKNKYPGATETKFYRINFLKWQRLYNDLQRFRNRRPELYEEAMIGLVDWIGRKALPELRETRNKAEEAYFRDLEG